MVMKNALDRIFKRGEQPVMDKTSGHMEPVHAGGSLEPKHTCSLCKIGCDVVYAGLKPVLYMGGEIAPHHTLVCVECYRKQRKEIYPDDPLPV